MADFSFTDPSTWGDALGNVDWGSILAGGIGAAGAAQGTSSQTTKPYMVNGQEQGLVQALQDAKAQYGQGPLQYYPGQTIASLDPNVINGQNQQLSTTQRLQDMANRSGRGALSLSEGGADRVGGFQLQDQIGFGIPKEYQDAIMNPIMDQLNQEIIPGIHTAATSQGAFGGSRMQQQKADAATQATKAATDAMIMGNLNARQQSIGQRAGDISAQLQGRSQDIMQNELQNNAMVQGTNAMNTAMNQQLFPGQVMQDVGNQRMAYDQSLIGADKARFDFNALAPQNNINNYLNQLGGTPTSGSTVQGNNGSVLDMLTGYLSMTNQYNTARGQGGTTVTPPPATGTTVTSSTKP